MNIFKSKGKKVACINHREERYGHYLDALINGNAKPGDVTLRWNKIKNAKGNK